MLLECRHLCFKYPGTDKTVFKDLALKFDTPGFHSLFGPSGVGKSSLARVMCGLLSSDKGEIHCDTRTPPLYTHNLERLPGWSTVGRHLDRITPAHHLSMKNDLLKAFGLTSLLAKRFSQLSLGQQNRINLLRYLVQEFQILVIDECLANVDEKMRVRILLSIKEAFPERLFVYISHNVIEVASFCRQIWVLRSLQTGNPAVMVRGQDSRCDTCADRPALQQTMLEIMNAA